MQQTLSKNNTTNVEVINASYYTLLFKGDLDEAALEQLKPQIDAVVDDQANQKVIFDFSQLDFINSHALGYLVSVQTHLSKEGRKLVIAGAFGTVMDVMTLIGLPSIIQCAKNVEEATQVV